MESSNPILSLKEYIEKHRNDSGGDWEYVHTPQIQYIIEQLTEEQYQKLRREMWNWSEFHLEELADPILFALNKQMNSFYVYMQIFGRISDLEKLEYLAQNVGLNIPVKIIQNWEIDDLKRILNNFDKLSEYLKNEKCKEPYHSIRTTFKELIQSRTKR
jgi:hypothetical protein